MEAAYQRSWASHNLALVVVLRSVARAHELVLSLYMPPTHASSAMSWYVHPAAREGSSKGVMGLNSLKCKLISFHGLFDFSENRVILVIIILLIFVHT